MKARFIVRAICMMVGATLIGSAVADEPTVRVSLGRSHAGWVQSIAFSSDSKWLVSGGEDGCLMVWDLEKRTPQSTFAGFTKNEIKSVAFSPDDKLIAAASGDGAIYVFDRENEKQVAKLKQDAGSPYTVKFTPDGKFVVAIGNEMYIPFWDLETKKIKRTIQVSFGSSECSAFDITLWDVATGKEAATLKNGTHADVLIFSPNGKSLLAASNAGEAKLWDLETKKDLGRAPWVQREGRPHTQIAFSDDGKKVFLATSGTVRSWNFADHFLGEPSYARKNPAVCTLAALSTEGKWLAAQTDSGKIEIWDVDANKLATSFPAPDKGPTAMAFSKDSKRLLIGTAEGQVHVYDVEAKQIKTVLREQTSYITAVGFAADGKLAFTACSGGKKKLLIWDLP